MPPVKGILTRLGSIGIRESKVCCTIVKGSPSDVRIPEESVIVETLPQVSIMVSGLLEMMSTDPWLLQGFPLSNQIASGISLIASK